MRKSQDNYVFESPPFQYIWEYKREMSKDSRFIPMLGETCKNELASIKQVCILIYLKHSHLYIPMASVLKILIHQTRTLFCIQVFKRSPKLLSLNIAELFRSVNDMKPKNYVFCLERVLRDRRRDREELGVLFDVAQERFEANERQ